MYALANNNKDRTHTFFYVDASRAVVCASSGNTSDKSEVLEVEVSRMTFVANRGNYFGNEIPFRRGAAYSSCMNSYTRPISKRNGRFNVFPFYKKQFSLRIYFGLLLGMILTSWSKKDCLDGTISNGCELVFLA